MDLQELEGRIERAVRAEGPSGLHHSQLSALNESSQRVQQAVSNLVTSRRIDMTRDRQNAVVLFISSSSGGLSEGSALVMDVIKSAGAEGVDATVIGTKTKLMRQEVSKAIKTLLDKKLVEETRSFSNKARRVYIVAGLAPATSVTGGVFYNSSDGGRNREIDTYFVDSARAAILEFVEGRVVASTVHMKVMLDNKSLPKALSQREVDTLARTLELDGLLVQVSPLSIRDCLSAAGRSVDGMVDLGGGGGMGKQEPSWSGDDQTGMGGYGGGGGGAYLSGGTNYRRAYGGSVLSLSTLGRMTTLATQVPCAGCPLIDVCSSTGLGPVNPISCTYLTDWLQLEPPQQRRQE